MKFVHHFALVALTLTFSAVALSAPRTESSFQTFASRWQQPAIYMNNEDALKVRLQLLDQLPPGSTAKILTFTFEDGESTQQLAAHVCEAAKQNVTVEFITDSKYGSLAGVKNLFDKEPAEELYQQMVNCGAGMRAGDKGNTMLHRIHNFIPAETIGDKLQALAEFVVDGPHSPVNRLNHRKLFWVKTPKGQACFLLGGRNLGDHYIAWHENSFIDADILVCNHFQDEKTNFSALVDQAAASFAELWIDKDPGGAGVPTIVKQIEPQKNFAFQHHKTLPKLWDLDREMILGHSFKRSYDWLLHKTGWARDRKPGPDGYSRRDEVREELNAMIAREQAEIYIESAFLDYDVEMQKNIESALRRGVKVIVVANSLFTSGGGAKLLSIVRQPWTAEMLRQYGGKRPEAEIEELMSLNVRPVGGHGYRMQDGLGEFRFLVTTVMSGHFIHFKGAGFKCQKGSDGSFYKSFLLGSHNFHERSGLSDKEHALSWKEPIDLACAQRLGMSEAVQNKLIEALYMPVVNRNGRSEQIVMKPEFYDLIEARLAGFYLANNYSGRFNTLRPDLAAFGGGTPTPAELGLKPNTKLFLEGNRPLLFGYRSLSAELSALGAEGSEEAGFSVDRLAQKAVTFLNSRVIYKDGTNFEDIPEYRPAAKNVVNWMMSTDAVSWIKKWL